MFGLLTILDPDIIGKLCSLPWLTRAAALCTDYFLAAMLATANCNGYRVNESFYTVAVSIPNEDQSVRSGVQHSNHLATAPTLSLSLSLSLSLTHTYTHKHTNTNTNTQTHTRARTHARTQARAHTKILM